MVLFGEWLGHGISFKTKNSIRPMTNRESIIIKYSKIKQIPAKLHSNI